LTTTAPDDARRYRVRAPRTEQVQADGAAVYTRQVTSRKTVTPLPQRATLTFAPAPVGQSEDGDDDLTPGVARFRPARPGRPVVLERRTAGSWKEVMTSEQNDRGVARFNVPISPGDGRGDYRAVAVEHAGAHVVETNPETVAGVAPIWAEEFNGTSLDTGTWGHRHLGVRSEASQRSCAETSESVVSVKGGLARLRVEEITPPQDPDNCPHGEFRNAHIGTQDTFSFTYGVMAARIKFPHQEGQHGALWSQPVAPEVVPGEPGRNGAEIDAVEYFGDSFQNGALQHSIYYKAPDGQAVKVGGARDLNHLLPPGEKWSDGFHVYSVEWTPDEYIFRVNGHETLRTDEGVSTTAQYVILSLLTSDWELENMDADNLNAMQVDWVRVWQP
jgi:beta-glucanase (GH16 family)